MNLGGEKEKSVTERVLSYNEGFPMDFRELFHNEPHRLGGKHMKWRQGVALS